MTREIPKAYAPAEIEKRWAAAWVEQKLFTASADGTGEVFSIVLPPPNVTGSLHVGHMLEHTQSDILVRWRRMQGRRVLWLPGTDHAGIATQVVVERELVKQRLNRLAMGREEFERRVWEWKAKSGDRIRLQMTRLGASCDWTREAFTLDAPRYRAVLEAFLRLYAEGLIYRGRYIVNWCPRCQTALSDLETVHEERAGHLWYICYPVVGTDGHIVVATTRPETMLGDTAVAVHPDDERYRHLIGKKVLLPLMGREIPVIGDTFVDREFGTGAVKVTPAHDPNDFELAKRHDLPEIEVMNDTALMNSNAGPYIGLDRFSARKSIVDALEKKGLLERVENYSYSLGLCTRCSTIVEPRVSVQWFCKMKPLAGPAIGAVRSGLIKIVPENWEKVYLDWMERIHDWCISRQLWWGHRIPVWHCEDCGAMTPALDSRVDIVDGRAQAASPPEECSACHSRKLEQDPDVLDTWFSSALWPFSTMGWPGDTPDLRAFYPTSLLISGYDILFFWDARMIMMGLHLINRPRVEDRIPFRQLYLHAIVRDAEKQKMSKTRGNVVDPLEITEQYGTDAVRFTLAVMAAPGTDIALSESRILSYRAFANKIWNAARFMFVNLNKAEAAGLTLEELAAPDVRAAAPYAVAPGPQGRASLALHDRWIFSRLARTVAQVNDALENFRFHEAADSVYHFFWGDFCDWYIEWVKPQLAAPDAGAARATWRNLFAAFEAALRLLHPFMPFLTEELWHRLPQRAGARSIALERFPEAHPEWLDDEAESAVALLQEIITAARNIRAELKLDPRRTVAADFHAAAPAVRALAETNLGAVLRLGSLSALHITEQPFDSAGGATRSTAQFDLRIRYEESVDVRAEVTRLRKEKDRLEKDIAAKKGRLADDSFRSRAPEHIVRGLEATLQERTVEYEKLLLRLAAIEKSAAGPGTS
jgi:valyl-tRNA synthetase